MLLGIDIGGTTISLGLVDKGRVISRTTAPSFSRDDSQSQTIDTLISLIEAIIVPQVKSIGIGVPSVVDTKNGIVYDAANIPSWKEIHLKEILEERFGIPVSVNNDANCYALGAVHALGCKSGISVGVTLGTGVGMGVIVDGKVLNGRNTGVGELSCLPYGDSTLENYCSRSFFDEKGLIPAELGEKARKGDPSALATFRKFGQNLAVLINVVMLAYDPDCIIFGGGIANNYGFFHDSMVKGLEETFPYKESLKDLRIEYMPQSETALVGASLL